MKDGQSRYPNVVLKLKMVQKSSLKVGKKIDEHEGDGDTNHKLSPRNLKKVLEGSEASGLFRELLKSEYLEESWVRLMCFLWHINLCELFNANTMPVGEQH